ncbi:MAG: LysR family transcriptional regulator, partial [Candidatus Limnocylindria bacterium]
MAVLSRSRRGSRPTEVGRAYLAHAERALQALAEGRRLLEVLGGRGPAELLLGAAPAVSTYV